MLYKDPCVFAVGHDYQIAFNTTEFGIAWVEVAGKQYRDSKNGLMRSETLIHKVTVPMRALDEAKAYRVCFRALPERRPYFPQLGELETADYAFKPVDFSKDVHMYMLADTHSRVEAPCRAAQYFGDDLDILLLNGDIPAESKTPEDLRAIYDITSEVAHGQIPVIFARGNHDYRGRLATDLPDYIGTRDGHTYFTFRIGSLWGIALDCGEDKMDTDVEYGGLVDCHDMRLNETEFIKSVIAHADEEYLAPGVKTRIAVAHLPFTSRQIDNDEPKFNIERDIFAEWTALLNQIKPDVMFSGHMHRLKVDKPGDEDSRFGAEFPVIIGSAPLAMGGRQPYPAHPGAKFIGIGITFGKDGISVRTTDDCGADAHMFP